MSGLAILAPLAALGFAACVPARLRPAPAPASPGERLTRAVRALDRSDFGTARIDLAWLASNCAAGAPGQRALLVLASADLDPNNPRRSPLEAARLAKAYLLLPSREADGADVAVARDLYLLALDLGEAQPALQRGGPADADPPGADDALRPAARFGRCGEGHVSGAPRRLPALSQPSTGQRIAALQVDLARRTDSLLHARERLTEQDARIAALQTEIARIQKLLKAGGGDQFPLPE